MMKSLKKISTFLLILASVQSIGAPMSDEFYKNRMIEYMAISSRWILQDGMNIFSDNGFDAVNKKLIYNWGAQIWHHDLDIADESADRVFVNLTIKGGGIYYDIRGLYRENVNGTFYEFWVFNVAPETWSNEKRRSEFFITKSTSFFGQREIIKESDQFIDSYSVDGVEIRLPVEDLYILYILGAWWNPQNYQNSDLDEKEVRLDSEGNYYMKKPGFRFPWQ